MSDTAELLQQAQDNLLFVTKRPPIVMQRGEGCWLWDTTGKRYLDFIGGWAVTALGHSPACISKALAEQGQVLINASPSFFNDRQIELAALLVKHSCADKVWFGNSGAEVNEAAVKLARKYGSRHKAGAFEVITTQNSFHGRTMSMMSASGKPAFKPLFEPKTPGFIHVPFNDINAIRKAVTPQTIAIMLEPVQGEAGVNVADLQYLRDLRSLCDAEGILLILDEIQTGVARCGTLFAYEQYGIEPDIFTLAKGLGGGFPVAAVLCKDKCAVFDAGDQGGTFGGQPLAMAVGSAVLNEILDTGLCARVNSTGAYLQQQLTKISSRFSLQNIRGKGLLLACDLPKDIGDAVVAKALETGILLNAPRPNVLRFMPPLTVSTGEVDQMIDGLRVILTDLLPE